MSHKTWLAALALGYPLLGVQTMTTLSGNVIYRSRMALPAGAVVKVTLQDISKADAPAEPIASATIPAEGSQVPIPFQLEYDRSRILDNHSYSVSARIEDEQGRLLFISDTRTVVITGGNPVDNVTVMTRPAGRRAYGSMRLSAPVTPGTLEGTRWVMESLGGKSSAPGVETTLEFLAGGRIAGRGGCNRYTGSGKFSGVDLLEIGPVASTRMACAKPEMSEQEDAYFKALSSVKSWRREAGALLLAFGNSSEPIRFRLAHSSQLEGAWLLEDLNGKGVLDRVQPILEFRANGQIGGRGGCNSYGGKAELKANNELEIGSLASTLMACNPAVDNQEREFLRALTKAKSWRLDGSLLFIDCEGYDKPLRFSRMTK